MTDANLRDRFRGCLLGGAVGDALGGPVEFMRRSEIFERFGPEGITEYAPAYGGLGRITDDTQMTLFTAEGLIRAWVRGNLKGICSVPSVVGHAYIRWLLTQGYRPTPELDYESTRTGWLFQQKELHSQRAPGNTCLTALREKKRSSDAARNDSKGCGGVMRVAPVGLYHAGPDCDRSLQDTFDLGVQLAALTHGHPTGSLPAGVLAVLVRLLANGIGLEKALRPAIECLREAEAHDETLRTLFKAAEFTRTDAAPEACIRKLGGGWVAEEALAISVYCCLKAKNIRDGVVMAVNHDGDSDSTGAIAGNLLGTMHGVGAIPGTWLQSLELREVITELADDLFSVVTAHADGARVDTLLSESFVGRYPGA